MELKPGYKQTEVGVIPEDWKVKPLVELTTEIGDGIHTTPNYISFSEFFFINGNNLFEGSIVITENTKCVSEVEHRRLQKRLTKRTVLLSINGTIGNLAFFNDEKVVLGKSAAYINVAQNTSRNFIFYALQSKATSNYFEDELTGTTIRNLSLQSIRNTPIPIPTFKEEQQAIATALSDVDAQITSLDKLIVKKRDIKQATMQQLLNGGTRLPGFSEEWKIKKLGDVSVIKTGKRNNEDKVENGHYPFFVRSQTVERINTYSFNGEAILVPGEGGIGSIFHYINGKFDYHQRVYKISDFRQDVCGKFVYFYMLQNFNKQAMRNSVKATVDSLRLPTFQEFEFLAPSFDEQQAIAAVLSDMESEIAVLEQKRDKTRDMKQGMMQELLTGKTRLV